MPATTASSSSLLASLPTFMSVFGEGSAGQDDVRIKSTSQPTSASSRPPSRSQSYPNRSSAFQHASPDSGEHRRGSTATVRTESTESSPTTTISTVDSTLTDPSPSSSPESPASSLPLANLTAIKTSPARLTRMDSPNSTPESSTFGQSTESPNKRPRNTKNLSINTTGISTKMPATSSMAGNLAHVAESTTSSLPAVANPKTTAAAIPGHVVAGSAPKDLVTGHAFSAPASPSFIVPSIPPPKKSRLGLTITTSERESFGSVPETPSRGFASMSLRPRGSDSSGRLGTVPETPALVPLSRMREGDSGSDQPLFSPSVAPRGGMRLPPFGHIDPTLPTPGYGPAGGMQLPPIVNSTESSPYGRGERLALNLPTQPFDSPGSGSVVHHTVEHNPQTPLHELPLSREAKSPGYPDGPICIYPPSVFLYHQPTREEAQEFDVIINVAREVANPFLAEEECAKEQTENEESRYKDAGVQCTILPGESEPTQVPPSAVSEKSFTSALENFLAEQGPETPKAATTPTVAKVDPEYIHLPWEHNSKVYDEWLRVCDLIDDRVKRGKKVLIHCQLGVSRSASLIVAYGIYKNPRLSPDEARENAKKQSRWIDLNMHFMYELGDFKKLLAEKYPSSHLMRRAAPSMGLKRTTTDSFLVTGTHSHEPMPSIADESSPSTEQSGYEGSGRQENESLPSPSNVPSSAPAGGQRSPGMIPEEEEEKNEEQSREEAPREDVDKSSPFMQLQDPPPHRNLQTGDNAAVGGDESPKAPPGPINLDIPTSIVKAENKAENTSSLPTPNLTFPPPPSPPPPSPPPPSSSSSAPRPRGVRPVPSLPAGFSGLLSRRSPASKLPFRLGGESGLFLSTLPNNPSSNTGSTAFVPQDLTSPTAELLSPRAAEFAAPFRRSAAGDLAGSSFFDRGMLSPPALEADPRSPPAGTGGPVRRNIEDVL